MSSQIGALFLLQPQKLDEFDSVLKAAKAALLVLGQPLLAMLYEQRAARGQLDNQLEWVSP